MVYLHNLLFREHIHLSLMNSNKAIHLTTNSLRCCCQDYNIKYFNQCKISFGGLNQSTPKIINTKFHPNSIQHNFLNSQTMYSNFCMVQVHIFFCLNSISIIQYCNYFHMNIHEIMNIHINQ
ncbi:unnamed protein product [Paramecium sonneborni]|uniref:Uncharacterized protein n=1 Tax=Paramecium sonneborni TaxID=65129 RepID=A0A8S1R989_9CILI|nr:unnamed protein product [Paramecium sonneborni]